MCDNLRIYIDQNKSRVRAFEDERNPANGICVSHLGLDLEHKKKKHQVSMSTHHHHHHHFWGMLLTLSDHKHLVYPPCYASQSSPKTSSTCIICHIFFLGGGGEKYLGKIRQNFMEGLSAKAQETKLFLVEVEALQVGQVLQHVRRSNRKSEKWRGLKRGGR